MKQTSYVMVKPGFANNDKVVAEVKKRLKENGISILEEGFIRYDEAHAKRHYHEHVGKSFYPGLEAYITSDKAYGMKVEGEDVIARIRALAGSTKNPEPGTIRYDIPKCLELKEESLKMLSTHLTVKKQQNLNLQSSRNFLKNSFRKLPFWATFFMHKKSEKTQNKSNLPLNFVQDNRIF